MCLATSLNGTAHDMLPKYYMFDIIYFYNFACGYLTKFLHVLVE